MRELQFAITVWLGVLLIVAAVAKFRAPHQFSEAVAGYGLLPRQLLGPTAWLVPGFEVAIGVALLGGWYASVVLRVAAATFLVFSLAMAQTLIRGQRPSCGCGVGEERPVSWLLVARALGLAVLAGVASLGSARGGVSAVLGRQPTMPRDAALAALITLLVLGLVWRSLSVGLRVHSRMEAMRR